MRLCARMRTLTRALKLVMVRHYIYTYVCDMHSLSRFPVRVVKCKDEDG